MDEGQPEQKFQAPMLPPILLHRGDLIRTVEDAFHVRGADSRSYKLVLFCAPAGYGKTVLLVDAIQRLSCVCCWYRLDVIDNDPAIFLRSLLASIRFSLPTFGVHLVLPLIENESPRMSASQAAFLDALKDELTQQFILILCNYHEINQNAILNQLVGYLLAHLPQQGVIAIESRSMPNLALTSLIAHRQMFGIGSQGLRFTSQEVYDLARLQGIAMFSFQEAERLTSSFEGWIAGILCSSRLGYFQLQRSISSQGEN